MCTIGIAFRAHPTYSLIIAANRDELLARPASPPTVLQARSPRIVGGRDLTSGGTWMGANDAGLVVGITNQRTFTGADRTLTSRGDVVMQALRCRNMAEVRAYVADLDPRRYNEFNLLFSDGRELDVLYARHASGQTRVASVPEGFHALPNDEVDHPAFAKAGWLVEDLSQSSLEPNDVCRILGSHRKPDLSEVEEPPDDSRFSREMLREVGALCIHTKRYGTRSATFVALADGEVMRYLFADGPPCQNPFVDYGSLFSPQPR